MLRRGKLFVVLLVCGAAVLPTSAQAAGKRVRMDAPRGTIAAATIAARPAAGTSSQLWTSDTLNRIANDAAGYTDMQVVLEDDATEWASFFAPGTDAQNILGFVLLSYPPLYHQVILSPFVYTAFNSWLTTSTPVGNEFNFAVAVMTLVHESFHWRLMSGDESAVNACALKFFGAYLAKDFNVPTTITQTTTEQVAVTTQVRVPTLKTKLVKKRVKVKGKWVTRSVRKKVTVYVTKTTTTYEPRTVTSTVANPLYATLTADANLFYSQQPPPYNAGTCPI
jgi:hypothetical protein